MSQEDVLTLIRLARKYPDATDSLLAAAERIGRNGAKLALVDPGAKPDTAISFPIEVFCTYKGHTYRGLLSQDRTVVVNGKKYNKPSPAAMSITNNNVNGLRWWWYRDPVTGQIRQIKDLENRGLI